MVNQKREVAERGFDGLDFVAVLLGLHEIADGAAEVFLLHAQESHAGGDAAIVGIGCEKRGEALLGFVEAVRVERSKGGALRGRARDAGVHLRQLGFALLEAPCEISVSWG